MGNVLLDTNVVLRLSQVDSDLETLADIALKELARKGDTLHLTPQVMCEYWCSVTRPTDVNGFGWDPSVAYDSVTKWISLFTLLPEVPSVFGHWLELVHKYEVKGKRTHDARLVAVMLENGVDTLLTFNTGDFEAFTEIKVIHPADVVANAT